MNFKSYGLRKLFIAELIDENAADIEQMYGPLIQLEGARSFELSNNYETVEENGDDQIMVNDSTLMSIEASFENLVVNTDALKILEGVRVEDIMSTDAVPVKIGEKIVLDKNAEPKYFGIIGYSVKNGSRKIALPKAKCVEGLEWSMVGNEYAVLTGSAIATHRNDGVIRQIFNNDSAIEPSKADFE